MTDRNPSQNKLADELARDLLRIGAVSLSPSDPFTWASGRRSPVYCDNRLTMGFPNIRARISQGFAEILKAESLRPDIIVGTATAGIPHAAWLADRLALPMAYVRSKPKGYGKGNQIEGLAPDGARAVVIEDLVSTGMSSTAVIAPLREAGIQVDAVLAIFTYGLPESRQAFKDVDVPLFTLSSFPALIEVAAADGRLTPEELTSARAWYEDPLAWSEQRS